LKEIAQECCAFTFAHAADYFGPMVAGGCCEDTCAVLDSAAFRIVGAEHQSTDAEEANGVGAHRAGFQRDDELAVWQARLAESGRGRAQRPQFGVCGGIGLSFHSVAGAREHPPVRSDHDCADGNFAARRGRARLFQCYVHGRHTASLPFHSAAV